MTNQGATVKLTEKQRETIDRLAERHGEGYVELKFVRPNTWRSLVAAGLVSERVDHVTMKYKLTDEGCAAAGIKPTYVGNVAYTAEGFARIEHLRRGNDAAMRTAEAAYLRDSQVLLDPYGKRIAAVGTELVNGRTRLWTVDLDEPDQSPKWVDATPAMMNIVFARAEGWVRPLHMRRADSDLLFRVLGSDAEGVSLVAVSDEGYELHRDLATLIEDNWIATDHEGVGQMPSALRSWVAGANSALAKTVKQLQAGCPAGSACTGAAFPGHPAHAIEGVLEEEGYHLIGEVPRAKPVRVGIDSSYWVVPLTGQRLTDRYDVLGPYADLDLAEYKQQQYTDAGHPCRVVTSVSRPVPRPVSYLLRDTETRTLYEVHGTAPHRDAPHVTEVWVSKAGERGVFPWSPAEMVSNWNPVVAVDGHNRTQNEALDEGSPRGRAKTVAELAADRSSLTQQLDEAREKSTDPAVRAFYNVGDQVRQLDGTTAEVLEVVGETVTVRTPEGETWEREAEELERADAVPPPPMTLAEYTAHVAASATPARRAAMGSGA